MNICVVCLWLQASYSKFPTSSRELRVVVALVGVGFLFTACPIRPLMEAIRFLEQRKRPRGERGRQFLKRVSDGQPLALRGRDLRGTDLVGASLENTDLSDADLRGADLSGAILTDAHLRGALYDASTRWPDGFDPQRHGAVRVE